MKKYIFTIALFIIYSNIFAGDIKIKYLSLQEIRNIKDSIKVEKDNEKKKEAIKKAKDIQSKLSKVGLKIDTIDGVLGNQTKVAFDSIKARLLLMGLDTNDEYNHTEYRSKLNTSSTNDNSDGKKDYETNTKNIDITTNKDTLLFIIIFLLVLNLIYLISKPKIDRNVKNLINKYIEHQANEDDSNIKNEEIIDNKNDMSLDSEKKYKDLENENISLKSKVKNLELKIQNLESEILRLKSTSVNIKSDEKETDNNVQKEIVAEPIKEKIIYAQIPEGEIFNRISENISNPNFIFKLIVKENNAEYNYIDNDNRTLSLLKSDPETYIVPFFKKQGLVSSNFKITKPGKAKLENGKWRIIEKGTVEFY